jgi:hypothetical protein
MNYKTLLPTIIIFLVIICVICKMNLSLMFLRKNLINNNKQSTAPKYIQINSLNLTNLSDSNTNKEEELPNIVKPIIVKPRKLY